MDNRTMTLTRTFAAPVARVWQAWTDPAILPRWFGPDGLTCRTHEIDLRAGGLWRFDMVGPNVTYANRHRYTTMDPMTRIAFLLDDDSDARPPITVNVTFAAEGAGTRLTQVMVFPDDAAAQAARDMGAERYGYQTLAKLAAMVAA